MIKLKMAEDDYMWIRTFQEKDGKYFVDGCRVTEKHYFDQLDICETCKSLYQFYGNMGRNTNELTRTYQVLY